LFCSISESASHTARNNQKRIALESTAQVDAGAILGRILTIPVKQYKSAFRASLKLGQCPLVMKDGSIQTCSDEFTGENIFIGEGSATVDVTRVQNSEDIFLHTMGGVGTSVGILGIVSVNPKVTVSVTTDTSRKSLSLINSYEMSKGILALHNPKPKQAVKAEGTLFLSEIQLGGNEMLLVTLEFESEAKKTEVEISYTFKILFISISAKLKFIKNNFKSDAKVKIQFKSSWRPEFTEEYPNLDRGIPRVETVEKMYMDGPKELRKLKNDDEKVHNVYYFSSWNQSPYGKDYNAALINHDLNYLTEQNTEIMSAIHRIKEVYPEVTDKGKREDLVKLNSTLTEKTKELTTGLNRYHALTLDQRKNLLSVYGEKIAPQYYRRQLERIIA
ncbi:uncharacterized protein LOC129225086, partial [Uloborus diversus]|uniref:uncharacterized protein LOC129225086 n=1 Tax=Uloborus diversus TaxID=327109 RepID=UPI00240A223E